MKITKDRIISIIMGSIVLLVTVPLSISVCKEIDYAIKYPQPIDPISFALNAIILSLILVAFSIILVYLPKGFIISKHN